MAAGQIKYPKFKEMANLVLLNKADTLAKWNDPKTVNGMRFGGVGLVRVGDTAHKGYAHVAGNDLGNINCPVHQTPMSIDKIQNDTNHNIKNSFFYKCYEMVDIGNGDIVQCSENLYPIFPKAALIHLSTVRLNNDAPYVVVLR